MAFSAKSLKTQLSIVKPLLESCSLKSTRRGQDKIGELMESRHRDEIIEKKHDFGCFQGAWIIPKDERRNGVILYLHGGGYTCGGIEYAKGFGTTLAVRTGTKVFCPAYRLAPENPYPAAMNDALTSYKYLLEKGFQPSCITLCGESAGGGLCYSLCLKLKEENIPLPCSVIAVSPWTDLTASGESYKKNAKTDPTMSEKTLSFFADCYTTDRKDPFVSPMFADLSYMPPSLIFAGGDEIMLDDAVNFHEKLLENNRRSKLTVTPDRWHGYLLFDLEEDKKDYNLINTFLNKNMASEKKLNWLKLDNAAKIYPAARTENWSNLFRLSATMKENVDKDVLASALDVTVRRFPSIAVRLRRGFFWYYLEEISEAPAIKEEAGYPLTRMSKKEMSKCAFRVIVYKKRIAVEFFHSLTDGNGALIFLKSLTAEYVFQKYGTQVPAEKGVLGRLEQPSPEELEDSFQKYSGDEQADRREKTAWHMWGTPEPFGFLNLTCFELSSDQVLEIAHKHNVSVTAFLCAVMMTALQRLQAEKIPNRKKRKPVKVLIPVNLRKLFPSRTLRNFALYTTPEILPGLGDYGFDEICSVITHRMGAEITPKQMSMKIAANVNSERMLIVRIMPLFLKNIVMKAIFDAFGERKSCLTLSNLGNVEIPDELKKHVERMDFILGVQAAAPYNCGVISYGGKMNVNFIRNIKEPELEYFFHEVLKEMGVETRVSSNRGE